MKMDITNVRSFGSESLDFSRGINLLVGRNNAGKSMVLLPIMALQNGLPFLNHEDVRVNETTSSVSFRFDSGAAKYWGETINEIEDKAASRIA